MCNLVILICILYQCIVLASFIPKNVILADKYLRLVGGNLDKLLFSALRNSQNFVFLHFKKKENGNNSVLPNLIFSFVHLFFFKSFTLRGDHRSPASAQKFSSRSTVPTPAKRRSSALWSEMLDITTKESLTTREIKRQEVCWHSAPRLYLLACTLKRPVF